MRPGARRFAAGAVIVAAAACAGEPDAGGEAVELADQHVALVVPDGWTESRERGSVVLGGPAGAMDRTTFAVRALARPEADTLLPDTLAVLRALPEAQVGEPRALAVGPLTGHSVELSFVPPGRADRYARRHVVLAGERWAFHVIHTAPGGALAAGAATFERLLTTLREVP